MTTDRSSAVRRFITSLKHDVASERLEADQGTLDTYAESFGLPSEETEILGSALRKIRTGEDLLPDESLELEAIILPDLRPVIDVID